MKSKNIKSGKEKYLPANEPGSELNLSFSSRLVLGSKIIALDGINKRLLVSAIQNGFNRSYIIDLDKAISISVKKRYSAIKAGELNEREFEEFLESIYLQFEYGENVETIELSFYQRESDNSRDIPALERNARDWQMILSKMTGSKNTVLFSIS